MDDKCLSPIWSMLKQSSSEVTNFLFNTKYFKTHTHIQGEKGEGRSENILKKLIMVYIQNGLILEYTTKLLISYKKISK